MSKNAQFSQPLPSSEEGETTLVFFTPTPQPAETPTPPFPKDKLLNKIEYEFKDSEGRRWFKDGIGEFFEDEAKRRIYKNNTSYEGEYFYLDPNTPHEEQQVFVVMEKGERYYFYYDPKRKKEYKIVWKESPEEAINDGKREKSVETVQDELKGSVKKVM